MSGADQDGSGGVHIQAGGREVRGRRSTPNATRVISGAPAVGYSHEELLKEPYLSTLGTGLGDSSLRLNGQRFVQAHRE